MIPAKQLYFVMQIVTTTLVGRKIGLVVETVEERRGLIDSINNQAHLGKDKTLSEISSRHYRSELS